MTTATVSHQVRGPEFLFTTLELDFVLLLFPRKHVPFFHPHVEAESMEARVQKMISVLRDIAQGPGTQDRSEEARSFWFDVEAKHGILHSDQAERIKSSATSLAAKYQKWLDQQDPA